MINTKIENSSNKNTLNISNSMRIKRFSQSRSLTILLRGETGTGTALLAPRVPAERLQAGRWQAVCFSAVRGYCKSTAVCRQLLWRYLLQVLNFACFNYKSPGHNSANMACERTARTQFPSPSPASGPGTLPSRARGPPKLKS